MSQFSASGGQSIGISASAPVLPMNIQGWTGYESYDVLIFIHKSYQQKTVKLGFDVDHPQDLFCV